MSPFSYNDYKEYVRAYCRNQPNLGRGQFLKISKYLKVTPVTISQVFKGNRDLSLEQSCELTEYLQLSKQESEYFLIMVQLSRAGSQKLKSLLKDQLLTLRKKSSELKTLLPQDAQLNEQIHAQFYSNWQYSAIRNLSAIEGFNTIEKMAEYLRLPRQTVEAVMIFLLQHGLCIEDDKKIKVGPQKTHLEASSPYVTQHHKNWRIKGFERMELLTDQELFYTGPMTLSQADVLLIKEDLTKLLQRVIKRVEPSPSEQLMCLNIDWFKV